MVHRDNGAGTGSVVKPTGLWNPDQLSVRVEMLPLMRVGRYHKQFSYFVAPPVGIPNTVVVS